jgi:GTPase SAR1 family protein
VYIKNADLIVVAYDCSKRSSFEEIPATIKKMSLVMEKNIKGRSILISTKCDLEQELKEVTEEEARLLQN